MIKDATSYEDVVPEAVPEETAATEEQSKEVEAKTQEDKTVPEISKKKEKKKWFGRGKKN